MFTTINKVKENSLAIIVVICLLTIWEFLAKLGFVSLDMFPPPTLILIELISLVFSGTLQQDLANSFIHYGIGLALGASLGLFIGILMGWFKLIDTILNPIIQFLRSIPPVAWIPAVLLWLGLTPQAAGFIIAIAVFFVVVVNTYSGIRGVDKIMIDIAKTLGANDSKTLILKVILPSCMPSILTGLRIGFAVGWMFVVAAELFMTAGLGYRLIVAFGWFNMRLIFAVILIIGIISIAIELTFRVVESVMLKWRRGIIAR